MSSSDGGILAEGETSSSEASGDSTSPPCDLGLFERLLLTHPVWFLPGIQRAGAVHLLQGKEEGVSFSFSHQSYHLSSNFYLDQAQQCPVSIFILIHISSHISMD